jgi:histidyl-tRNA synthetase
MSNRAEPIRSVKGTRDLLPPDTGLWQRVESEAHRVFAAYHYGEIRTPILEETALFARGVGAETDIVTKEMYTFLDREDSLTLRPEATASVVRAYIEHSLYNLGGIQKLYYIGPMFRRERPQKGRYRQFFQIGAEVLGSDSPLIDAEVLEMLALFLERVGIREYQLLINSVGCAACRPAYIEALRAALGSVAATLCPDCQRRAETNPLRVLDCTVESDQSIIDRLPKIIDYLDPACRTHFDRVRSELEARALPYRVQPRLVRGLDYYTRTTFEITSGALGAQNALVGGGRYDGLIEMLGGPPTPGIGFSIGQDRLILAVQAAASLQSGNALDVFIVWMGEQTLAPALRLLRELRAQGVSAEIDYEPMKIKKAMGIANKLQARFAIIIGEGELASGKFQVKNMATTGQTEIEPGAIAEYVKQKL